jgi:CheY-like chemotaxis protein
MDVQMPVMDGLTAARKLRERESASACPASRSSPSPPTPWPATGRCACGRHGRLPRKPVTFGSISTAMLRWLPATRCRAGRPTASQQRSRRPPRHRVFQPGFQRPAGEPGQGGRTHHPEHLTAYLREGTAHIQVLSTLGDDFDLEHITRIVHNLKSSSAALGLAAFSGLCREVEQAARSQQRDKVREQVPQIVAEFEQVRAAARQTLADLGQGEGMNMDNRKPHILVVDDEPVMRTITESVLAQQEFEVSTANSAERPS